MATADDVVMMIDELKPAGPKDQPVRHQAILLLWAIGRAGKGEDRLVRWKDARPLLVPHFAALGREGSRATPEYPFVALTTSPIWEIPDADDDIPPAHQSLPLRWLNLHNPHGGLARGVYTLLAADPAARAAVAQRIVDRFFADDKAKEALALAGVA